MVKLVYSPQWFYGKDILIDLVSIFVLCMIALFSIKSYKIRKNRNYLYLALSFGLLAVSFLFKILMNFNIYFKFLEKSQLGAITETYHAMRASNSIFPISFLFYWLLTLFAVYVLYSIYEKQSISNHLLNIYLIFVSTYLSYPDYYVFHITLLVLLALVTFVYSRKYLNTKHFATKLAAYSFGIIAASQIFFILVNISNYFYVVGELVQLIGYAVLLSTFIMVLKYGRTKDTHRHNRRYAYFYTR
ncbi:hypothetical protein HYX02_00310 [Candidatus Woesearchaeota archaeon]|nr:hypothetical protein [Candidatus Woesearchaeota archaeon]